MQIQLLAKSGDDLLVVNAARVSFAKESKKFNNNDAKLIDFLAEHKHFLPFRHPQLTFRCSAPLSIARQLGKYQVGFSWSEESRRYITDAPKYYRTSMWRKKALDKKQGSIEEPVDEPLRQTLGMSRTVDEAYERFIEYADDFYKELIEHGVCPEQTRMVLPQAMYVNWVWTGSLLGFANLCKERLQPDTQKETRQFAKLIYDILLKEFPIASKALLKGINL